MNTTKSAILSNICYTELVYGRINKKLKKNLSRLEIEKMLLDSIENTSELDFQFIGKNIYIRNADFNIKITINKNTFRVITVGKLK